ncbi:hypothetical protein COCC4DRAFT_51919 [Bipolaris maydis ATCC 48331]|uniref:Uncharacterized protein n=2 Tax=Cochliobolus heterostrophus TaxID=5016 RepID=M2TXZ6_COCH5|nr:uncharacterized protein COCC4DRAFT_51919 [Bipolaris maydis ATCC 48331]EMD86611.1 hypothetical protein COCHEDRAFT_1228124 [Bipolaris maydis C5]KAJ6203792.1 hypothetical protein PSV09DRAFT_1228124 [Bipolaris maydis]ENI03015.1 hypothetical protein COCC4DRAFT_51919 [Bipolaris maydis ATCC 48331]KAJ6267463.1 hypothetical protein PSV08DRAFT_208365 [Bipolaris maydis]KAJ6267587.1 hypothetical protein PSV08DRAFT_208426 [Bipolaris maydis]
MVPAHKKNKRGSQPIRNSQRELRRRKAGTYNKKDSNGTTPPVDGCTKSPNIPLSRKLTPEKHVSTIQGTQAQNTMHLSSSKSTTDSDRSGHKDTTILTPVYRNLRSITSNKQVAAGYQNLPQWTEKIERQFGFNQSQWDSLKNVSVYHIRGMTEKSPEIPWEEYSDEEREECFEEISRMFRVITEKVVTSADLELLIPWFMDPQNNALRKDAGDKKAAAIRNDKENLHVQSSNGLAPPDPLPAIHCMHFDATGNTKIDADKFDDDKKATLTRIFDPIRNRWILNDHR